MNIETKNEVTITNPADLKKIKGEIDELINSLVRENSEKELRKEILDGLKETYALDKKTVNRIARDRYKDTHSKSIGEYETYEYLYDAIYNSSHDATRGDTDTDNENEGE